MRFVGKFAASAEFRSIALLRLTRGSQLFQPYPTTRPNRYPRLFQFARDQIGDGLDRRILSFGCATGEEVFALRHYFPAAEITGIDINPRNIRICRARGGHDVRLSFRVAACTSAERAGFYDAIFCMAVLRHGELAVSCAEHCDHLIRFADFAALVGDFARCLKPGGLLFIRHSNFRFRDTAAARGFEVALRAASPTPRPTPLYGPDNRLMRGVVDLDVAFRKIDPGDAIGGATRAVLQR